MQLVKINNGNAYMFETKKKLGLKFRIVVIFYRQINNKKYESLSRINEERISTWNWKQIRLFTSYHRRLKPELLPIRMSRCSLIQFPCHERVFGLKWNVVILYITKDAGKVIGSLYCSSYYRLPLQERDQVKNGVLFPNMSRC